MFDVAEKSHAPSNLPQTSKNLEIVQCGKYMEAPNRQEIEKPVPDILELDVTDSRAGRGRRVCGACPMKDT